MSESKTPTNKSEKSISSDLSSEILCTRVTALRKENALTLEQLAKASGVSRSMLSQIERGQANPTLAVTFRIAQAFGVTIGELVDEPWTTEPIEVVHGKDSKNIFRSDSECKIRTLSPLHIENSVEFYELRIAPNSKLESAAHFEGTKELLTVTSGRASLICGDTQQILDEGDSAHYHADVKHTIENKGNDELYCYLVVLNQS